MRVLLADDAVEIRHRLERVLATVPGIEVVGEAGSGLQTLEAVRRFCPEAVVLDLHMPEGSGFITLEALKTEHPGVMVIVLTNYTQPVFRRWCLAAGADYFLDKSRQVGQVGVILEKRARHSRSHGNRR